MTRPTWRWPAAILLVGAYALGAWAITKPVPPSGPSEGARIELEQARAERASLKGRLAAVEDTQADTLALLEAFESRLADVEAELARAEDERDALAAELEAVEVHAASARQVEAATPAPSASLTAQLDRLAACESGGDPRAYNPAGPYLGAFQFDAQTWRSVGGTGDPRDHPYATQRALAAKLHGLRGWAPWPACSAKLGLR